MTYEYARERAQQSANRDNLRKYVVAVYHINLSSYYVTYGFVHHETIERNKPFHMDIVCVVHPQA